MKTLKNRIITSAITSLTSLLSLSGFLNAEYVIDPYCYREPCRTGEWYFEGAGLWWEVKEDGLVLGTEFINGGLLEDGAAAIEREKFFHLKRRWNYGYRVGFGYHCPYDCWDFAAFWTHFQTKKRAEWDQDEYVRAVEKYTIGTSIPTVTFIPNNQLNGSDLTGPIVFPDEIGVPSIDSHSHWNLNLDLIDLEFGRAFCVSRCIKLRPHVGARAARIGQHYRFFNSYADGSREFIKKTCAFRGVGVRGGFDTDWDLGCCMSLYGRVAATIFAGDFETDFKGKLFPGGGSVVAEGLFSAHDNFCACRAASDAAFGIRWRWLMDCFCSVFTMSLGWEHHYFWNQNHFLVLKEGSDTIERGDLCAQGVVLTLRYDF